MSYTFPSDFMKLNKFKSFMKSLINICGDNNLYDNNENNLLKRYFYAFDSSNRKMLNFNEFLIGLAAMEPHTMHGGAPAEQRCRYIFRYYSYNYNNNNIIEDNIEKKILPQQDNFSSQMNFEQFK